MTPNDAPPSPSKRFRFSLRRMLLVIAVVVMALSHLLSSYRLFQANQEIAKYRREMGYLNISDPAKIHVVAIPPSERYVWSWRVYVPPDAGCMLRFKVNDITPDNFPENAGGGSLLPGESVVEVRIDEVVPGKWKVRYVARSINGRTYDEKELEGEAADWLDHRWASSSMSAGEVRTDAFDVEERVTLIRLRSFDVGVNQKRPAVARGLLVWLEPFQP